LRIVASRVSRGGSATLRSRHPLRERVKELAPPIAARQRRAGSILELNSDALDVAEHAAAGEATFATMKGFLVLLVLTAAGVAGVLYWRRSLEASHAPVAATGEPTKKGKERHRRRHGARRLARNEAFAPSVSAGEAPVGEAPAEDLPAVPAAPPERAPAPIAPGGSATTEAGPSDVFGSLSSPSGPAPSGGRRQPVDEPEPVKLRPADLKHVWQGEDLSKAENQRLDFSKDAIGRELSQSDIDARFRTKEDAVLGCIARARPDEYTDVPGRVNVRFRILRTGAVKGVQVEAPAILQRGGLTGCISRAVTSLRFPASDSSQVITYPFSLL
jgi:hypothetical protein